MGTETIQVSGVIHASPERIYQAWLDSEEHTRFTGGKASVESGIGGRFTAWDGHSEDTIAPPVEPPLAAPPRKAKPKAAARRAPAKRAKPKRAAKKRAAAKPKKARGRKVAPKKKSARKSASKSKRRRGRR